VGTVHILHSQSLKSISSLFDIACRLLANAGGHLPMPDTVHHNFYFYLRSGSNNIGWIDTKRLTLPIETHINPYFYESMGKERMAWEYLLSVFTITSN